MHDCYGKKIGVGKAAKRTTLNDDHVNCMYNESKIQMILRSSRMFCKCQLQLDNGINTEARIAYMAT